MKLDEQEFVEFVTKIKNIIHRHLHRTAAQDGRCYDAAVEVAKLLENEITLAQNVARTD